MDIVLNMLKMLTRWKPEWLYEAMPYVYLVAGFATIFYFGSTAGYVSGTLFLIAVFFIWVMRVENRKFKKP